MFIACPFGFSTDPLKTAVCTSIWINDVTCPQTKYRNEYDPNYRCHLSKWVNWFYTRRIKKQKSYYGAPQSQTEMSSTFLWRAPKSMPGCRRVLGRLCGCSRMPRMPTPVLRGLLIPMNDVDTGQQYDQTLSLFPRCMKCQRFRAAKKLSEKVVYPSVRLYVCQTRATALWHNGRKTCPDFSP